MRRRELQKGHNPSRSTSKMVRRGSHRDSSVLKGDQLDQWFSARGNSAPLRDIWQHLETFLAVETCWGEGILVAFSGERARRLLNIPRVHRTAPHPQQTMIQPKVSIVLGAGVCVRVGGMILTGA